MKTIEQIKACEKWKQSQKSLEEFSDIMKLIEQYPIRKFEPPPHCQPYITKTYY